MVDITVDTFVEEDYFTDLMMALEAFGVKGSKCEEVAHHIMDAWTFDNLLDTNRLDTIIDRLLGVEVAA